MNSQLVIDLMHQRLLPLIADGNYRLLPSAEREILHDKSFQPIFPYTVQSHSYFEWVWCVENHSYLKIQDKVFRLEAGDFCLLPPGEIHADVYIPSLTPYKVIWSSYHRNRIESSYHVYTPINHLQLQAQVCAASPPSMTSLLGMLMQELMILNAHREPICKGLVLALTHLMLRSFKSSIENEAAQGAGELSARVDEYLHKHFNKRISLNDVARALHFSRNYLAALYKQETQKTIGQMLTEIRLRHAKQLLL